MKREISYLEHKVSENGITPGDGKISAIRNFVTSTNETEVRQFLGLTGFFRKFVEDYSLIYYSRMSNLFGETNSKMLSDS